MGDLNFISDVIYGLKIDMGQMIIVGQRSTAPFNIVTGVRPDSVTTFMIPQGIYLPINRRQQFLQTAGIHKTNHLEQGQREVLIDKADIPSGSEIKLEGGFIEINGQRGDIVRIEDYDNALIVVIKEIKGMPQ